MSSVCVVGAGVSGLTTAIELIQHGHRATVIADASREGTTSSVAAAFWYPFWTGQQPDHSWYRATWAWDSFLSLDKLADTVDTGVTRASLVEYFDEDMSDQELQATLDGMWWQAMGRTRFEALSDAEISSVSFYKRRFRAGIRFQTLVVNMSCYLPYLEDFLILLCYKVDTCC